MVLLSISQKILRESFRLLAVGGQIFIFDGNQKTLRQVKILNDIFEEPYLGEYAAGSLDAGIDAAGFAIEPRIFGGYIR